MAKNYSNYDTNNILRNHSCSSSVVKLLWSAREQWDIVLLLGYTILYINFSSCANKWNYEIECGYRIIVDMNSIIIKGTIIFSLTIILYDIIAHD